MKRIAIDIDMVLVDTSKIIREFFKEKNQPMPSVYSYDFTGFPEAFKQEIQSRFKDDYYMGKEYLMPRHLAQVALHRINDKFDIQLLSNRVNSIETTRGLIRTHFPFFTGKIKHVESKVKYMLENRISILIDDTSKNCKEAASCNMTPILISNSQTPYNINNRKDFTWFESLYDFSKLF